MRFFFDRCMAKRLARMVDAYDQEHTALAHDDDPRFTITTPDIEWLAELGKDDPPWAVISADARILRNKVERQVLREAKLTFFYLGKPWTHMPIHEYAWKFIKAWRNIVEQAVHHADTPTIFEVSGGTGLKVTRICNTRDPG